MSTEGMNGAIKHFKAGEKVQASVILSGIVEHEPDNADAWYGLALCTSGNAIV